ncbi:MAG: response regulator [Candidatus Methylacidiphilales bacterium]|nr:response regulator [Candidatus Methylacidiphilales bacterium]
MQPTRVFLVDDNKGLTLTFKHMLEARGYAVEVENKSAAAINSIKSFQPDIIFLDVVMPLQDGGDVYNRLKATPQLAAIPVVFFTSMVTTRESRNSEPNKLGHRYLPKPSSVEEIERVISDVLK